MSQGNEKDVQQLLELSRDKSDTSSTRLVQIVGDLFFEENSVLSECERALMTDILCQLIHDVEMTVRKVLAERLADEPDAPPNLVKTLANDQIEYQVPLIITYRPIRGFRST